MKKFFNLNRFSSLKKENYLSEEDEKIIEESTYTEIEKVIEELKKEEENTRNILIKEFKDVFKKLPIVL